MPIEHNIEELENLILDTIGEYEDTIPKQLAKLVSDVTYELKSGNYKNQSGDLRRSIQVKLQDYNISIKMLEYGYYVSFGVSGGKYRGLGLPTDVAAAFGVRENYKFNSKKRRNWGIKPRNFYPTNLEDKLLEILLQED